MTDEHAPPDVLETDIFLLDHERKARQGKPARTPNLEYRLKNLLELQARLPPALANPLTIDEQATARLHRIIKQGIAAIRLELKHRGGEL